MMDAAQPPSDCGDASPLLVRAATTGEIQKSPNHKPPLVFPPPK